MSNLHKNISKLMSLVLRHQPDYLGITLDEKGWTSVNELIGKINQHGITVDLSIIEMVVETNDKKRFAFNEDKTLIRANQGHSVEIDLQLNPATPPEILYHGTVTEFLESILQQGLQKQNRHHVHLSEHIETAKAVGSGRGKPVILIVNAKAMTDAGFVFYRSENNVWLTDEVPVAFLGMIK
jgi:putative RNA 2'-phosphotransferase